MNNLETGLLIWITAAAFLYASVGHGGASAYLAAMALWGMSPVLMKPLALLLNIAVSALALYQFRKAGHFKGSLFTPLVLCSIPFAFAGGSLDMNAGLYKRILGALLMLAAIGMWRPLINSLFRSKHKAPLNETKTTPLQPHLPAHKGLLAILGAAIGFVSGLIGIGGGILLSPLLLAFKWTSQKQTAALSAGFILLNSVAGLAGQLYADTKSQLNSGMLGEALELSVWVVPFVVGAGFAGAYFGSKRLSNTGMRSMLGIVLLIAALKLCTE